LDITPAPRRTALNAIQAVLFDLDGTLADTAPDLAHALNAVLEEQGRDPLPYEHIRSHVSQGGAALVRLGFGADLGRGRFEALRARFLEHYQSRLCVGTRLFPGMAQVLESIERQGLAWGVVTNKPTWLTDPLITALDLTRRAGCIVCGDTTEQKKPHPRPLLHACQCLGLAPARCLYVGDDPRDVQAGKAAGMSTLVARYGYIHAGTDPAQWDADGCIDTALDLLAWLRRPAVSAKALG
jgi:2-phosphoglycolate phosphatase